MTCGEPARVLAAAEAAADLIDELAERIAIMGETLTEKEWNENKKLAQRRAAARKQRRN